MASGYDRALSGKILDSTQGSVTLTTLLSIQASSSNHRRDIHILT